MADRDDNNIAILEDNNGDLIIRANPFDLANTGLRFEPAGGGYAVTSIGAEFRSSLGRALTLGDDDSVTQTIALPSSIYGRRFTSLFVNSDGNVTFEEGDNASTERGLGRLASGAPRIAPFFADLDPSAGGRVFFDSAPDATTITWCAVPGFDLPEDVTVQAVLLSNGVLEFRFGTTDAYRQHRRAFAGPHRDRHATGSEPSRRPGDRAGRHRRAVQADTVARPRRRQPAVLSIPPRQLRSARVLDRHDVVTDAFAFESTVKNAITGTGLEVIDFSAELGSGGALQSVINMDRISKYPDAPATKSSARAAPSASSRTRPAIAGWRG